jgi:hypothetical protein
VAEPEPPTLEEYHDTLKLLNRLTYFKQPPSDPEACVGLNYNGQIHTKLRIMLDSGANINIMTEDAAKKMGIPIRPTSIRLTTSNEHTTPVLGITPPVQIVYGVGSPAPMRTNHYFLVTKGMDSLYQVLIGNLDTQKYGGITDAGALTHTLRPQFPTVGIDSTRLTLPTVYHSTQGR